MEKETRSALERATQRARSILEADFADQLEGDYDVLASGHVGDVAGAHLDGTQKSRRARIVASIQHKRMAGMGAKEAMTDYLRDAAFTTLNRFVALKMLEARGLVQECITKGEASSGFVNEYLAFASGAKFPDGSGYRLYIESIFDELSTEVKVLFDRRDPAGALWPRKATFDELLTTLNAVDLQGVWIEDETIGWVYQYFNSTDERRKMREESQAPRNSRELAIRNQFFTPSYVVQFLADNTLGRIWYEMRKGDTRLAEICEYMVRQQGDVFADESIVPVGGDHAIPHRLLKDPRDLRVIDPACGSGHFLLYCFLLLIVIYEEAWNSGDTPSNEATGKTLRQDYPDFEELRKALPGLILTHNLHGVDIDPRCAQIAQLALWMRAQRAYQDLGVARSERPIIRRSNIVIAEPMPGDVQLVDEFAANLTPPVLGHLFKEIVSEMTLAGEMGSLLPIERRVTFSIQRARKAFVEYQDQTAQGFLPGLAPERQQRELDLSGIDDDRFFEQAEDKIFASLKAFVADAVNGVGARRRLFADDAEQGLALVDLSRKQFDVVLMNPPFGDPPTASAKVVEEIYPGYRHDISTAFVDRARELSKGGLIGVLMTRTPYFLTYLTPWREDFISREGSVTFIDLGQGVLDALVETCALCIDSRSSTSTFVSIRSEVDKVAAVQRFAKGLSSPHKLSLSEFKAIDRSPFIYWVPATILSLFSEGEPVRLGERNGYIGAVTQDDFRYTRLWWEVSSQHAVDYVPISKAGTYQPFVGRFLMRVFWKNDGKELKSFLSAYREAKGFSPHWTAQLNGYTKYFRPGITWTSRPHRIGSFWVMPEGTIFGNSGPALLDADEPSLLSDLAVLNSPTYLSLLNLIMPRGSEGDGQTLKYELGYVTSVPFPTLSGDRKSRLASSVAQICNLTMLANERDETNSHFDPSHIYSPAASWSELVHKYNSKIADIAENWDETKQIIDQEVRQAYQESGPASAGDLLLLEQDTERQRRASTHHSLHPRDGIQLAKEIISICVGIVFGRYRLNDPIPPTSVFSPEPVPNTEGKVDLLCETSLQLEEGISERVSGLVANLLGPEEKSLSDFCAALGTKDVASYLEKSFFDDHISLTTAARRRAPLYWRLSDASGQIGLWLYAHAASGDTLYRALHDYIGPQLSRLRQEVSLNGEPDVDKSMSIKNGSLEAEISNLQELYNEISMVAPIWRPDARDGVLICASPLWRLFGTSSIWMKATKSAWDELYQGIYDWTHMAMHLWPERVVPKCATDRSLAIAHGLEDVFWFEDEPDKWKARKSPLRSIDDLVAERTSLAVKDALKKLIEAPNLVSSSKRIRKSKAP